MSAEDRDGLPEHSAFVYAFDGGSTWTNEFSIDAHTGLIVTRRPLDREVSLPHRPVDDILAANPTRSSAIAEGPRDASRQLKSCQLPRNSAETTCSTSPEPSIGCR